MAASTAEPLLRIGGDGLSIVGILDAYDGSSDDCSEFFVSKYMTFLTTFAKITITTIMIIMIVVK